MGEIFYKIPQRLEKETNIPTGEDEKLPFIVNKQQIAVGGSGLCCAQVASGSGLLEVDDGGLIYDKNGELFIEAYYSNTVKIKGIAQDTIQAIHNHEDNVISQEAREDLKRIRRLTGKLVAKVTGKPVLIQHIDGIIERIVIPPAVFPEER